MNWYRVYPVEDLPSVPWQLFQQFVRWNIAVTEFLLEYREEPMDKTGVMTRDEASAYTKNPQWELDEIYPDANYGEG